MNVDTEEEDNKSTGKTRGANVICGRLRSSTRKGAVAEDPGDEKG